MDRLNHLNRRRPETEQHPKLERLRHRRSLFKIPRISGFLDREIALISGKVLFWSPENLLLFGSALGSALVD